MVGVTKIPAFLDKSLGRDLHPLPSRSSLCSGDDAATGNTSNRLTSIWPTPSVIFHFGLVANERMDRCMSGCGIVVFRSSWAISLGLPIHWVIFTPHFVRYQPAYRESQITENFAVLNHGHASVHCRDMVDRDDGQGNSQSTE